MKELVAHIARSLVENPEKVEVLSSEEENQVNLELHVDQDDMGKVIGKQGRIAKAIRVVVKAAATKEGKKANLEIR